MISTVSSESAPRSANLASGATLGVLAVLVLRVFGVVNCQCWGESAVATSLFARSSCCGWFGGGAEAERCGGLPRAPMSCRVLPPLPSFASCARTERAALCCQTPLSASTLTFSMSWPSCSLMIERTSARTWALSCWRWGERGCEKEGERLRHTLPGRQKKNTSALLHGGPATLGRVEIRVREDLLCQCASHSLACRPLEGAAVRTEGRAASVLHQGCCAAGGCARNNNARPISSGLGFDAHHGSAADDAAASHHAGGGGLGIEGGVCGERMKRGGQCCCNPAPTFFRSALSAYFARPLRASALHAWSNGASMLMRQQPGITRGTGKIPETRARAGMAAPPPLPRIARRSPWRPRGGQRRWCGQAFLLLGWVLKREGLKSARCVKVLGCGAHGETFEAGRLFFRRRANGQQAPAASRRCARARAWRDEKTNSSLDARPGAHRRRRFASRQNNNTEPSWLPNKRSAFFTKAERDGCLNIKVRGQAQISGGAAAGAVECKIGPRCQAAHTTAKPNRPGPGRANQLISSGPRGCNKQRGHRRACLFRVGNGRTGAAKIRGGACAR